MIPTLGDRTFPEGTEKIETLHSELAGDDILCVHLRGQMRLWSNCLYSTFFIDPNLAMESTRRRKLQCNPDLGYSLYWLKFGVMI